MYTFFWLTLYIYIYIYIYIFIYLFIYLFTHIFTYLFIVTHTSIIYHTHLILLYITIQTVFGEEQKSWSFPVWSIPHPSATSPRVQTFPPVAGSQVTQAYLLNILNNIICISLLFMLYKAPNFIKQKKRIQFFIFVFP